MPSNITCPSFPARRDRRAPAGSRRMRRRRATRKDRRPRPSPPAWRDRGSALFCGALIDAQRPNFPGTSLDDLAAPEVAPAKHLHGEFDEALGGFGGRHPRHRRLAGRWQALRVAPPGGAIGEQSGGVESGAISPSGACVNCRSASAATKNHSPSRVEPDETANVLAQVDSQNCNGHSASPSSISGETTPPEGGAGDSAKLPTNLLQIALRKGVSIADPEIWFANEVRVAQKNKITRQAPEAVAFVRHPSKTEPPPGPSQRQNPIEAASRAWRNSCSPL